MFKVATRRDLDRMTLEEALLEINPRPQYGKGDEVIELNTRKRYVISDLLYSNPGQHWTGAYILEDTYNGYLSGVMEFDLCGIE